MRIPSPDSPQKTSFGGLTGVFFEIKIEVPLTTVAPAACTIPRAAKQSSLQQGLCIVVSPLAKNAPAIARCIMLLEELATQLPLYFPGTMLIKGLVCS